MTNGHSLGHIPQDVHSQVVMLQTIMMARATHEHGAGDIQVYSSLRTNLIRDGAIRPHLPQCVHVCRSLDQFWTFIKSKFGTYDERRNYLAQEFNPLLTQFELQATNPVDDLVDETLRELSTEEVQRVWERALERREEDPEAAITSARSLLEAVCKQILEEAGEQDFDLDNLYRQTARLLDLSPDQQSKQSFKQLSGACGSIVHSIYSIRNQFGDAHGRSGSATDPLQRHAEFAVNIAGSLALFLVRTRTEQQLENSAR